jgi:hypothetical protein
MAIQEVDRQKILEILGAKINAMFVRKPIADFEYLQNEATPPFWLAVLLGILAAGASVGLSLYLSRNPYRSYRF